FFAGGADVVDDHPAAARLHLRIDRAGEVDVAEHLQLPGVAPGRLIDLVDRAAGNVAGVVDEDVDVGGILHQFLDVRRVAQIHHVGGRIDLVLRSQAVGERLQLVAAAGGETKVTTFLGEGFGGGCADAFGGAGDENAFAAQMQVHGSTRCFKKGREEFGGRY